MAEDKKYCIRVPEALVEVSEAVYLEYYRARRRWYAQGERDTYNNVVSYDAMDTDEILGEETIPDSDSLSVEDAAFAKLLKDKLYRCLSMLPKEDQALVHALFYEQKTEREYAKTLGVSQNTVNKRRKSVLSHLRRLMRN